MAKAGLENMTKSLAIEWARYGIRLNAVASGVFRTEGSATRLDPLTERGWNGANNPMGRIGELEEMGNLRSEEHTSELQSLMRISYAGFCLKKKKTKDQ